MPELIDVEQLFDDFLLCDIEIYQDDELVRKGKLKMVTVKNHNIKIYLDNLRTTKVYELFYPLSYTKKNNQILFDYSSDIIVGDSKILDFYVSKLTTKTSSELLNSKILIKK